MWHTTTVNLNVSSVMQNWTKFWNVRWCGLSEVYWCFREMYYFHLQGWRIKIEDREIHPSKNKGERLVDYVASYPRKYFSSEPLLQSQPLQPQISWNKSYLFSYSLFNDAASGSHWIATNSKIICPLLNWAMTTSFTVSNSLLTYYPISQHYTLWVPITVIKWIKT